MESYEVIIEGTILPGFDVAQSHADLARLTGQTSERVAALLSGTARPVKRGLDAATAERFVIKLREIGIAAYRTQPAASLSMDAAGKKQLNADQDRSGTPSSETTSPMARSAHVQDAGGSSNPHVNPGTARATAPLTAMTMSWKNWKLLFAVSAAVVIAMAMFFGRDSSLAQSSLSSLYRGNEPPAEFLSLPLAVGGFWVVGGQVVTVAEYFNYAFNDKVSKRWRKIDEKTYSIVVDTADSVTAKKHRLELVLSTDVFGDVELINGKPFVYARVIRLLADNEDGHLANIIQAQMTFLQGVPINRRLAGLPNDIVEDKTLLFTRNYLLQLAGGKAQPGFTFNHTYKSILGRNTVRLVENDFENGNPAFDFQARIFDDAADGGFVEPVGRFVVVNGVGKWASKEGDCRMQFRLVSMKRIEVSSSGPCGLRSGRAFGQFDVID